jgi:hypothetical protein
MNTFKVVAASALMLGLVGMCLSANETKADKPKFTIKQVMKEAHKSNLWKKVAEGKADKDEKEKLVELYIALSQNEPPKGDKEAWKKKTEAMLAAAKEAAKGEEGAGKKLVNLVKCADCHKAFKGN